MSKKPAISVLIPAYNADKYLRTAVNSILDQSEQNFEIIIVDDGSTDNTFRVAQKLAVKDSRIRVYQHAQNSDIAATRNTLLSYAKGKYIAWQDADDISVPDRLLLQKEYLDTHKDVGMVGGWLEFFGEDGVLSVRKYSEDDSALRKQIFFYSPVAQPAAMIRRKVFDDIGYYGVTLSPAEDIDMSFRIGTKFIFANIQQPVLKYRVHESATFSRLRKMEKVTIQTRCKYFFHPKYLTLWVPFGILFTVFQLVSLYSVPTRWKIALFTKLRNSTQ